MKKLWGLVVFVAGSLLACHRGIAPSAPSARLVPPPLANPTDAGVAEAAAETDPAAEFAAARGYLQSLGDKIDYKRECFPISEKDDKFFFRGAMKLVCHLRAFPNLALLIASKHTSDDADQVARDEPPQLQVIVESSRAIGAPISVVPFDANIIEVPCTERNGKLLGEPCPAFLEGWLSPDTHRALKWVDFEAGYPQFEDDPAAMKQLCRSVSAIGTFFEFGGSISDIQGFLSLAGETKGTFILADPLRARAANSKKRGQAPPPIQMVVDAVCKTELPRSH